jgi:putative lipoprotein (rSAM/lipoprotein system)
MIAVACITAIQKPMKKAEIRFFKTYNAILGLLLAFFGFAVSCSKPMAEYGTPSARFIVNGKVESSETNNPIRNIQVSMEGYSTLTDSTGHYRFVIANGFPGSRTFPVNFLDTDGPPNGEFTTLDTTVVFKDPHFINGDGHWYYGETTKEFDIKLNPKK